MSQFATRFVCAGQQAVARLNRASCHASLILSNLGLQPVLPSEPPAQTSVSALKRLFAKVSVQNVAERTVFRCYIECALLYQNVHLGREIKVVW